MCEILTTKYNEKNKYFSYEEIEKAIENNNDGCGYVLFEMFKKNKYKIKELNHIPTEQEEYESLPGYTSNEDEEIVFNDFMISGCGTYIDLYSKEYHDIRYTMPKELRTIYKIAFEEQVKKLDPWLKTKKIKYDFTEDIYTNFTDKETMTQAYTNFPRTTETVEKHYHNVGASTLYLKQQELKENELLIMHFRKATSGSIITDIQPILHGNFLVVHNGIFSDLGNDEKSDTRDFTELMDYEYSKLKIKSQKQEKKFLDTFIKKPKGYYSMFIYSWKTQHLYYYKKDASFHMHKNLNLMSTVPDRFPKNYNIVDSMIL